MNGDAARPGSGHVPKFFLASRGVSADVGAKQVRLHFRAQEFLGWLEVEEFAVAFDRAELPPDVWSRLDEVRRVVGQVEEVRIAFQEDALERTLAGLYTLSLSGFHGVRLKLSPGRAAVTGRYLGSEGEAYFLLVFAPEEGTAKEARFRLHDARVYAGIPLPPSLLCERFTDAISGWTRRIAPERFGADPAAALLPSLSLRCGLLREPRAALNASLAFEEGVARLAAVGRDAGAPAEAEVLPAEGADPAERAVAEAMEAVASGDPRKALAALAGVAADGRAAAHLRARASLLAAEIGLLRDERGVAPLPAERVLGMLAQAERDLPARTASLRAQLLLASGKVAGAAEAMEAFAREDPPLPEGFSAAAQATVRALLDWSQDRKDDARSRFEELWSADPGCFSAREALQDIYEEQGEAGADRLAEVDESLLSDLDGLPPGSYPGLVRIYRRAAGHFQARGNRAAASRCEAAADALSA